MNVDNIKSLIEHIRAAKHVDDCYVPKLGEVVFCMSQYFYFSDREKNCGTPSCIAGWAEFLSGSKSLNFSDRDTTTRAAEWMGLDHEWACDRLFLPYSYRGNFDDLTNEQAIAALERVIAAGDDYYKLSTQKVWDFKDHEVDAYGR